MIYEELSEFYDALVQDEEATQQWVSFTSTHAPGKKLLELACGSGEISHALAKQGYVVLATDYSKRMLEKAAAKPNEGQIHFEVMDMRQWTLTDQFETVICFCDSVNYLDSLAEFKLMLKEAYDHLVEGGILLFDMHAPDRLEEFIQEYIEEGYLDTTPYQWTIQADKDKIYQHFSFWHQGLVFQENHVQTVFDPKVTGQILTEMGFDWEVYTDFIQPGNQPGEKLFYVGRKL